MTFVPQQSLCALNESTKSFVVENWLDMTSTEMRPITKKMIKCHVTKERRRLWEFLDKNVVVDRHPVVSVMGSPGIGKSIISYAWVMRYANQENRRTLYLHSEENDFQLISIVDKKVALYNFSLSSPIENIDVILKAMQKKHKYELIVCDGANPEVNRKLFSGFRNLTILTISSFRPFGKMSQELMGSRNKRKHQVYAWTKEEVKEAVRLGNLLPIPPNELEEKMYYSGTCIRWLLKPIEDAKEDIDDKFLQVNDFKSLLSGNIGDSSAAAVNSLSSLVAHNKSIILSEYLVRNIADKATTDLVSMCRTILTNNPSWQGYVTELEVLRMFSNQPTVDLWSKSADGSSELVKETWPKPSNGYETVSGVDDPAVGPIMSQNKYLAPIKFNQALFDLLFIGPILRVIQITDAKTHEYKMGALIPWVKMLKCSKIELVVICRHHNFGTFKVVPSDFENVAELNNGLKANHRGREPFEPFDCRKIRVLTYQEKAP